MRRIEKDQVYDVTGKLVSERIVEVEVPPFAISKLSLRRALRSMGLESVLNQLLASDATIQADWDDAPHLMSDDPLLEAMIPQAARVMQISEDSLLMLLESAKIDP